MNENPGSCFSLRYGNGALLAALLAACCTTLHAQCPPGGTGPDVIVGELTGPSNYSSSNGIEALTIGTTSCNVGDDELLWISNSNQHPVIGQNLFRLKNGRFEQIGQAWLKHGFTALQQNACGCGCSPSGTGSLLGVGCSDPYSSSLNGNQSGMGPKWQVNAYKGQFNWPPANFNNTGNSIYKRLQVKISDIDPNQNGGGLYFAEGQYVTPDDSSNNNQNNNASYRQVLVSGAGTAWNFSLTGATQRTLAGIRAWKDNDPSVLETDVQIPGEGLVILAAKATDLGGGMWHYEYAVQNLNSDRSIGSFSIPVPSDATVTNIGFHDVDYHSGEPWDGTDWPGAHVGSEVIWETVPFSKNPNANAIRWGTLYNFRFDCDVPPAATTVTMGLFKPGSVGQPTEATGETVGPEFDQKLVSLPFMTLRVLQGTEISGGLPEMASSDDQYYVLQSVQHNNQQRSHFYVRLQSPSTTVQELNLTVEMSAIGPQGNIKSRIFVRDWANGGWDRLELFTIGGTDEVKLYANIPNPSDYIRSTNGEVRVRIFTTRGGTTQPFNVQIDQIEATVVP